MEFSENITRRISLWLDNEQGWYNQNIDWAKEIVETPPESDLVSERKKAIYKLSDKIEKFYTTSWVDCTGRQPEQEIIQTALAYVDWDAIAEGYISAAEEETGIELDSES